MAGESLVGNVIRYIREHIAGAIVLAIATAIVGATSTAVVPPGSGTVRGWRQEIGDIFARIEATTLGPGEVIQRPSGSVELFWADVLSPSAADLQKAVVRTNAGSVLDFYFSDGDLVFVYERGRRRTDPRLASDERGNRYYFRRGAHFRLFFSKERLFYWVAPGKHVVTSDHRDFKVAERRLLQQAHEIQRLANRAR
jgi:hypothetical protein